MDNQKKKLFQFLSFASRKAELLQKRDFENLNDSIFLSLLVLPLSTMFLMVGMFYSDIHIVETKRVVLMLGVSLLLFSNAFMFYQWYISLKTGNTRAAL